MYQNPRKFINLGGNLDIQDLRGLLLVKGIGYYFNSKTKITINLHLLTSRAAFIYLELHETYPE